MDSRVSTEWPWRESLSVGIKYGPLATPLAISPNSEMESDSNPYDMLDDEMTVEVEVVSFLEENLRKDTDLHAIACAELIEFSDSSSAD